MKAILDVVGTVLLIQGVGGVVNTVLGWWGWAHDFLLINRLAFLDGYEVFAGIGLGVLGFALLAAADSMQKKTTS
ncbi:hypothetical protein ACFXJ8_04030 [Nonomuraea sp. NPDC059194]|uniref:hypothetical protein n=1 Tax=Nonomuraea sp. NPDC059194 TaxID=3346764 RepID=UPI0036C35DD4